MQQKLILETKYRSNKENKIWPELTQHTLYLGVVKEVWIQNGCP